MASQHRNIKRYSTAIGSMLRQGMEEEPEEELTLDAKFDDQGRLLHEWKLQHGETSAEEHSYTYDEQGRLLLHHLVIPDDGIEERFVTTRNADGKALEIRKFYGEDPGERTVYVYAENGEAAEITAYDADGDFEQKEEFTYDDQKRMTRRAVTKAGDVKSSLEYTYNDQGLLAAVLEKDENGKIISRQTHDYTADNLEARILQFNENGKQITEILSEYDANNRLVMKKSSGFYVRINRYVYDEAGNLTEETLSDENGFVISRSHYEYDEQNRLIHETIYETDLTRSGRDTHYANRYEYS